MKLNLTRRGVVTGLVMTPVPFVRATEIPPMFTREWEDFASRRGHLHIPLYRHPAARLVFDDGTTTRWCWFATGDRPAGSVYYKEDGFGKATRSAPAKLIGIESVAPDGNGMPRFTTLKVG